MITATRDDAKRRLRWVAIGHVSLADVLEAMARQVAENTWTYALLYDARQRTGSLTVDELNQINAALILYWARLGPRGRAAIVVEPGDFGKSRVYSMIGDRLEGENEVFDDVATAELWLDFPKA